MRYVSYRLREINDFDFDLIFDVYTFGDGNGYKFNMGIKKRRISRWFQIRQSFVKNVLKNVISKNVTEICTFSTFIHVRQNLFCFVHVIGIFTTSPLFQSGICIPASG